MYKFLTAFFFVIIAWDRCKSLADSLQNKDFETQFNFNFFSKIGTMMDNVVANQGRWDTCKELKANETRAEENHKQSQLEAKLDRMEESLRNAIPQEFVERVGRMEAHLTVLELIANETRAEQKNIQSQFEAMLHRMEDLQNSVKESLKNLLSKKFESAALENELQAGQSNLNSSYSPIQKVLPSSDAKIVPLGFKKIGSRYYYIENNSRKTWINAESTCIKKGGHLAVIKDLKEWLLIKDHLHEKTHYWLGIYEKTTRGNFISVASDKVPPYIQWAGKEPKYIDSELHCVAIYDGIMYADHCYTKMFFFICQADGDFE